MNGVIQVVFIIAIFLLSTTAIADNATRAMALEYLELSKTKESFDMAIETYVNQLAAQNPNADKNKIRDFFNSYMGWEVLKEPTTALVLETFSESELEGINEFYQSKIGKALAEKTPGLTAGISQIIGSNLNKAIAAMK